MKTTKTEENYLKAIYQAKENSREQVATNTIAKTMNTSAASVTDMLKKLSHKGLVEYAPYKGAILSSIGAQIATQLIRKHRLWETFLVNKLMFSWEEVHDIAEELEHINAPELIQRLDSFLGNPKYDPHGDPIPSADGKFTIREQSVLSRINVGNIVVIIGVKNHTRQFLKYLNELNLGLGVQLEILHKSSYDHSIKVLLDDKTELLITDRVSKYLLVKNV